MLGARIEDALEAAAGGGELFAKRGVVPFRQPAQEPEEPVGLGLEPNPQRDVVGGGACSRRDGFQRGLELAARISRPLRAERSFGRVDARDDRRPPQRLERRVDGASARRLGDRAAVGSFELGRQKMFSAVPLRPSTSFTRLSSVGFVPSARNVSWFWRSPSLCPIRASFDAIGSS